MGDLEIFSIRLKELRIKKMDMTQRDFSDLIKITQQSLSGYENNKIKPPIDIVKTIAVKCNVSIDWLCGLSDIENRETKLEKYSDIITMLLEIDSVVDLYPIDKVPYKDKEGYQTSGAAIVASDYVLNDFIKEWEKFKKLLHDRSIDESIYEACIEKVLRDSDINIKDAALPFTQ